MKNHFAGGSVSKSVLAVVMAATFLMSGFFAPNNALANGSVTITPASGGTGISIDTTFPSGTGTWTVLSGPIIQENGLGEISFGVHTITLPAGWEFNTSKNVTIGVNGDTDLSLSNQVVTPLANSISFNISHISSTGFARLTFDGDFEVRPTSTTAPVSVNMTHSGTSITGVVDGSTNFGTISAVSGAATKIKVETLANGAGVVVPAQDLNSGSGTLTAYSIRRDQFNNFVDNFASTWSLTGKTGGVVNGDLVAAGDNKSATFSANKVGTTVIRAEIGGLTSTDSGTVTVHPIAPGTPAYQGFTPVNASYINASENTGGFTIRITGLGGAIAGDTLDLLGVTVAHSRILDSTDISNGYVDFSITAGDLGVDGLKSLTSRITTVIPAEAQTSVGALGFTLDTAAPTVNLTAPVSTNVVNASKVITFTDNELTAAQCSVDNTTWTACTSGETTLGGITGFAGLGQGTFTLYLRDTDPAGNIGTDSEALIIKDTANPTFSAFNAPAADAVYKTNTPLQFTPDDSATAVTCAYKVGSGDYVSVGCTKATPVNTTIPDGSFSDGRNTVMIKITDAAGNILESSAVSFVFDNNTNLTVGGANPDFATIQEAVTKSTANDTISVRAGTYAESVTVNKDITISGAGVTTIVDPAINGNGFTITANGVTIQNLKITLQTNDLVDAQAIRLESADSVTISGNTIETVGNKGVGIWIGNVGFTNSDNLTISNNTITIANESTGIFAEGGSTAQTGWSITGNTITANNGNPLELYDVTNSTVDSNTLTTTASGGANVIWTSELANIANLVFTNNIIDGSNGSQVVIGTDLKDAPLDPGNAFTGSITTVTITGNTFSNWGSRALRLGKVNGAGTVTGVVVHENKFLLELQAQTLNNLDAATVNAENNWWGSNQKSTIESKISQVGAVDFTPWYLSDAMAVLSSTDVTGPTVVLTNDISSRTQVRNADTVVITATFSDANGLDTGVIPTITITNGGVAGVAMTATGNLNVWTYPWDVPAGDAAATVSVSAKDIVGNSNSAATGITDYTIDNTAPTIPVANIIGTTIQGANDTIVITFDGPVVVADGTWSANEFTSIAGSVSGTRALTNAVFSYVGSALTITLNEATDGMYLQNGETITVDPVADAIKDAAGNSLADAAVGGTTPVTGDIAAPTVTLTKDHVDLIVRDADTVVITATFNETMISAPTISIDAVTDDITTVAMSGSGTTWTYTWNVPSANDGAAVVTVAGTDLAGNAYVVADNLTFTIDNTASTVPSANITTADGFYKAGQDIDITVNYSEAVTITGSPRIELNVVGGATRYATYNSGTGTTAIVFRYTVQAGDNVADLGASGTGALGLNDGTIKDTAGNNATNALPNDLTEANAVLIDTIAPDVNAGDDAGTVAEQFTQDATASDGGSGIDTRQWTKQLGPYSVTFGTATAEDTTVSAGGIGFYTLRLTVTDRAGNSNYDETSFTWDSLNVPILSYSPVNGATGVVIADGTATVTFGGSTNITLLDASKVTLVDNSSETSKKGTVAVSGGNGTSMVLNIPYSGLENSKQYRINILAGAVRDATGHINSDGVSYFTTVAAAVEPIIPTVVLNGDAIVSAYSLTDANTRFSSGVQFTVTNNSSVTVNGAVNTPSGGIVTAASNANAKTLGAHTYHVMVTSSTGDTAELTISYQVNADSVTPVTPTITLIGDAIVNTYVLTDANTRFGSGLQFTVTNNASVTSNGATVTPVAGVVTVATNAEAKALGAHTYNVVVTSSTGHTAELTVSYQVNNNTDAVAPTVTLNGEPAQGITQTSVNIAFQSNENGFAKVHYGTTADYGSVTTYQAVTASTDSAISLSGLTCGTEYHFKVYAKDASGNEGNSADTTFTTSVCSDVTAPTIISISLDKPAYRQTQDPNVVVTVVEDGTAVSVTINGLGSSEAPANTWTRTFAHGQAAVGTYSFDVVVSDGVNSRTQIVYYDVSADSSESAPAMNVLTPSAGVTISGNAYSVTFTSNGGTTTAAEVSVDGGSFVAATTNANPGTYTLDTTVLNSGSHTLRIRDTVGGVTGYSNYVTFIVNNDDITAPVVTPNGTPVQTITQTSANIVFQSSESGLAKVHYGTTAAYGETTVYQSVTANVDKTISLAGLTCGTTYHYSIYAKDGSGNEANTSDGSFPTSACPSGDITAPTFVSPLSPADNSTDVSVSVTPTITFSEPLDPTTVSSDTVKLKEYDGGAIIPATVMLIEGDTKIRITPTSNLGYNTHYYYFLTTGIKDVAGNSFATAWNSDNKASHEFTTVSDTATLSVTGISTIKSLATAGGDFADGWQWVFDVTVPSTEASLSMQFSDWTSGANVISVATNTRFYSTQSSDHSTTDTAITITTANNYIGVMELSGTDLDASTAGLQIQIIIETRVPNGSAGGSYSASYGIKSSAVAD